MRLALGISYNGLAYQGWQSQSSGQTVQDKLEKGWSEFTGQRVSTLCAGPHRCRCPWPDAGNPFRHTGPATRSQLGARPQCLVAARHRGARAKEVPPEFHCRASATSRRYAYVVLDRSVRPSIDQGRVGWVYRPLNLERMQQAAQHLLGEHDFSSFRASACQALSPVKTLMRIDISRRVPTGV